MINEAEKYRPLIIGLFIGCLLTVGIGMVAFISTITICSDSSFATLLFPFPFCLNPDYLQWGTIPILAGLLQYPLYACGASYLYRYLKKQNDLSLFPQLLFVLLMIHGIFVALAKYRVQVLWDNKYLHL